MRIVSVLLSFSLSLTVHAYDRKNYPHWIDLDGDGQNTREEILIRDSEIEVTFREDGKVNGGLWVCPYTGRVVRDPSNIDVDHLIALGEIDAAGASQWTKDERAAFANDPENLVAVYKGSNRSKGDKDAYLWLPPNVASCTWYLKARDTVWRKYKIEIDDNERTSAEFFNKKCPLHEKGIKLTRVRRWLGIWFEGLL